MLNVKELAGWCRRSAIMLNAGLDILTVLEREAGKYAHGGGIQVSSAAGATNTPGNTESFVPETTTSDTVASPLLVPPVLDVGSDFDDELDPRDYRESVRRRMAVWREKMAKVPRKPPVFLYSNMQKLSAYALGRVRNGASLHEAFSDVGGHFPKLFVPMVAVAERSGSLGETFAELARYYDFQLKLKREFWSMMQYPLFVLGSAVVIIFLFILIMGAIGQNPRLFGITFVGVGGAFKFLAYCGGIVALCMTIYYVFKHFFTAGNNLLHFVLNVLPRIGKAMRCFAMARFTWALRFTTKTGMDVNDAVALGFEVAAYAPINIHRDKVLEQLEHGVSLYEAFSETHGFPREFLMYVQTGEQSGELPETLGKLSDEYTEQTRFIMKQLSVIFYFIVFSVVVAVMVSFIFAVGERYFGTINDALNNPMGNP